MTRLRALLVMGTRPEAIKMAPVVEQCRRPESQVEPIVCFTGQHDDMLRQVTDYFSILPDFDLKLLSPGQSLAQLSARCLTGLDETIAACRPDCVVAQGDTASVFTASVAAFYRQIPFVHVEAGLRTGNLNAPWPEEFNRRVAAVTARLHCCPTPRAAENLRREGVQESHIRVTGNTVIDALLSTLSRERARASHWQSRYESLQGRELVLITAHRRENHGSGLENVFSAIAQLARLHPEVEFIFPVHRNPSVHDTAYRLLGALANVQLVDPLAYPEFVWLMDRSKLILSDSGGVQEEAPSLRRPVLALRESTERQESVECGAVQLVGTDPAHLVATVSRLLADPTIYATMQTAESPYGDGRAAERIVAWMLEQLPRAGEGARSK